MRVRVGRDARTRLVRLSDTSHSPPGLRRHADRRARGARRRSRCRRLGSTSSRASSSRSSSSRTVLEGAAPETVEREVTQVLEESINTIEGIRTPAQRVERLAVAASSSSSSSSTTSARRRRRCATRWRRCARELPRDIDPPVVDRVDPDASPILAVMVAGPATRSARLSEYADKRIKPRLERMRRRRQREPGRRPRRARSASGSIRSGSSGYGLAVDDVIGALQREHVELPGGRIETGRGEYTLKTLGKLTERRAVRRLVVARARRPRHPPARRRAGRGRHGRGAHASRT